MKIQKLLCFLVLAAAVFGLSCASQIILNDRQPTSEPTANSTPEPKIDDFAERLRSVQTGNFDYVYVFRRKDGDVFTAEDKKIFRENTNDVNQRQLTADDKALIVGSNYAFPPENFEALQRQFKVEDYSPQKEEPKKVQNSNVKAEPKKVQNSNVNR